MIPPRRLSKLIALAIVGWWCLCLPPVATAAAAPRPAARAQPTTSAVPASGNAASALDLKPCQSSGLPNGARCGTFRAPEDRDTGEGRQVALRVVVLPATGPTPARQAAVFIAGGPGEGSTDLVAGIAGLLGPLRVDHDILAVDLRGTGGSQPLLRCPYQDEPGRRQQYLDQFMGLGELSACRRELERKADLRFYTTPYAVDDLDDVRAALGYERLDLMGGSYGTRAALVYARRHPNHVRTLTLLGPVPTDAAMPLHIAGDFDASLFGLFAACAGDADCHAAFPALEQDLRQALARLDAGIAPVEVTAPEGDKVRVPMNRIVFAQALRYMLYAPPTEVLAPYAVHRAAAGDWAPVASFAVQIGRGLNHIADGLYLSVTCAEDVPFFTLEEGRGAAARTVLGAFRVDQQKAACALWPRGNIPADYREPVRVQAPALLIVGALDPAAPPRGAQEIAENLPNARLVVVPQAGHDTTGIGGGDCLTALAVKFMAQGSFAGLDLDCAAGARLVGWQLAAPEPAVDVPVAALRPLVGAYVSPHGLVLTITLTDGVLHAKIQDSSFVLLPLAGDRFRLQGQSGILLRARRGTDGGVVGFAVKQGAATEIELVRR